MSSGKPDCINGYLAGNGTSRFSARADHTHGDGGGAGAYAPKDHQHQIKDITDIEGKYADAKHTHKVEEITGYAEHVVLVTISVEDWSGGQTVTKSVKGVTESGTFAFLVDPKNDEEAKTSGLAYSTRADGSVTFTCTQTPAEAISMVVFV